MKVKVLRWGLFSMVAVSLVAAGCASSTPEDGPGGPNGSKGSNGSNSNGQPEDGDFGGGGGGADAGTKGCTSDPAFFDIPGDKCDNDGDGQIDQVSSCDTDATDGSAAAFARAIGICDDANTKGFGLVSASFTRGYMQTEPPEDGQHGVLSKFGNIVRPREGAMLGVLSTGFAEEFNGRSGRSFQDGESWWEDEVPNVAPPGFPKGASGCPQSETVMDVAAVKLTLKAPKNATGLKFDFNFYSSEWPHYICSEFNDGFVAWLSAAGFNGGTPGNVSFDVNGNPVSVNNGFFDRCTPDSTVGCSGTKKGKSSCPGGTAELEGTGYGLTGPGCDLFGFKPATMGGATGWLTSQAAVQPGETFTLEFMIWDAGDGTLDSSVLLDNFQWIGDPDVKTETERPPN